MVWTCTKDAEDGDEDEDHRQGYRWSEGGHVEGWCDRGGW